MNANRISLAGPDSYLSAAELDAISRLARDPAAPARLRLVEIAADLLDGPLGEPERLLVADVLLRMLSKAEDHLRQAIATRVASNAAAPRDVVLFFANDEIAIARPVLIGSAVLTDSDLVDIVQSRSIFHSRSIALRATLSEVVGESLVGTGDIQAMAFLLRNAGARISPAAALAIARLARIVESLHAPLLHRPEIPPEAATALYWHVSEELRSHIRSRFDFKPPGASYDRPGSELAGPRRSDLVYKNGGWTVESS